MIKESCLNTLIFRIRILPVYRDLTHRLFNFAEKERYMEKELTK